MANDSIAACRAQKVVKCGDGFAIGTMRFSDSGQGERTLVFVHGWACHWSGIQLKKTVMSFDLIVPNLRRNRLMNPSLTGLNCYRVLQSFCRTMRQLKISPGYKACKFRHSRRLIAIGFDTDIAIVKMAVTCKVVTNLILSNVTYCFKRIKYISTIEWE